MVNVAVTMVIDILCINMMYGSWCILNINLITVLMVSIWLSGHLVRHLTAAPCWCLSFIHSTDKKFSFTASPSQPQVTASVTKQLCLCVYVGVCLVSVLVCVCADSKEGGSFCCTVSHGGGRRVQRFVVSLLQPMFLI